MPLSRAGLSNTYLRLRERLPIPQRARSDPQRVSKIIWHNVRKRDERTPTLRQADQAPSDFAALESDLQFVMGQLGRLPARRDLAKTALGIIISAAALVWAEAFWRL